LRLSRFAEPAKASALITTKSAIGATTKYRNVCVAHENKDMCNSNPHCKWTQTECYMSLTKEMAIEFINKITEELVQNDLRAFEILQVEGYFVSDVVDLDKFTEKPGQNI